MNKKFFEDLLSEKLNATIAVSFKTVENIDVAVKQEEPVVQTALQMFGGKVVKEWPNGQK